MDVVIKVRCEQAMLVSRDTMYKIKKPRMFQTGDIMDKGRNDQIKDLRRDVMI
jgi:hypothetical protein